MKQIINQYKVVLLALFIILGAGCEKDFEELNQNPFLPTQVVDGALFNEIVASLRLGHNRQLYMHNEVLYPVTELGALTASTFQNISIATEDIWQNYYRALANARELEDRYTNWEGPDPEVLNTVHAQLKIIMAYKTFQVTDLFGAMPYTEAGRSFQDVNNLRPGYDDQESIYKSLIEDLEAAIVALKDAGTPLDSGESKISFGQFDTMFGNDYSKWIKFANGLLLRHLMRMVEKDPGYVTPKVEKLFVDGADFINAGEDIVMSPRDQDWDNWGVNWSFREHNKVRMGSNLWNFFRDGSSNEIIDPRARIFFETNNNDEWAAYPQIPSNNTPQSGGQPYQSDVRDRAYEDKGAGNIYSNFNYYLVRDNRDIPEIIMTSAEIKFLKAEVFARGIGVAQDFSNADFNYILGASESQNFWQNIMVNSSIWENQSPIFNTGELFSVVDHPKYNIMSVTDMDSKLNLIYAQRWVDNFRQPWEAFSLLRRTNRTPREGAANEFFRFQYPPSEANNNAESWAEQSSIMGGDLVNIKVWWMK